MVGLTMVMAMAMDSGTVDELLKPHCKSILGCDLTQELVDQFNRRVRRRSTSSIPASSP